jgi:hypothetical protein
MRTKVAVITALDRVLDGLAQELIAATDEEILAAARELGMDPGMRGSAAFLGLKYPILRHPRDFFDGFDVSGLLPPARPRIEGPATLPDNEAPGRRKKRTKT